MTKRTFEQDGFTVIVKRVLDDDPDLSWLTQDYEDCGEDAAKYREQDRERLDAYDRGEWYMLGVCVEIRKQTTTKWANGGLEVGRASVWGIESDSGESHLAEVEKDMIAQAFAEVNLLKEALCK